MTVLSIIGVSLAGLFIVATAVGLFTHRFTERFKVVAIVVAAFAVAFYVGRAFVNGPMDLLFGAAWVFNGAMSVMALRMFRRTRALRERTAAEFEARLARYSSLG